MNVRQALAVVVTSILCFQSMLGQQSTTGPRPSLKVSMGTLTVRASQVFIPGVPSYIWYNGCGPTALGMVVGFWDSHGYPDLITGSSSTETMDVMSAIASTGHYNDYSLPIDYSPNLLVDKSQLGGAHASDCIADFMNTSWSSRSNYYGWSWFGDVGHSFTEYVALKGTAYVASSRDYVYSGSAWSTYRNEIDQGKPVVLLVDSDGDGKTDHFVTGIGYDQADTTYGVYNTWDNSIHWYHWGPMQSGESWRVFGFSAFDISNRIPPPTTPILAAPPNGSMGIALPPRLSWNVVIGAESYQVQMATDSLFTASVLEASAITDTSLTVGGLSKNTRYYWRAKAENAGGIGPWSTAWNFTTIPDLPGALTLASPANNAVSQPTTLLLKWHVLSGATAYRLQMATDSLLTALVLNDSALTDTVRAASGLSNGTRYYWRVRGTNVGGMGPWPVAWRFTTIVHLPEQISLAAPADKQVVASDTVRFIWRWGQPSVVRHWFELAMDSAFTYKYLDSTVSDSTYVVRGLLKGTTFWWRVKGYNAAGWGAFREVRKFTVSLTSVNSLAGTPMEFGLSQNYPNPFNPSTTIRYGLPNRLHVSLTVFSTLGQQVAVLQNGEMEAGYHEVRFDGSGLSSGVYFYRIEARPLDSAIGRDTKSGAGSYVQTRTLLLLR